MPPEATPALTLRRAWMSALARSDRQTILAHLVDGPALPAHSCLRGPESGLVMLRGRTGGTGTPFNLGEITVSRCTVRNAGGFVGHAYVTGRDLAHAELAAALDAVLQDPAETEAWQAAVIRPLGARLAADAEAARQAAEATRVEFFTLTTMRS